MNYQKILLPVLGVGLIAMAFQAYGWAGVALVSGGLVMFLLLQFNRTMTALKRAADRPIGYVDSAVMLNAKLKANDTLLHVVAMTRAIGEQLSAKGQQPEIFRWTDNGKSYVTCEFKDGRLQQWELVRPPAPAESGESPTP